MNDPNDLFRRARRELSPTDADRSRNHAGVMLKVGAAGAAATIVTTTKAATMASVKGAIATKATLATKLIALATLSVGLAVPVAIVATRSDESPSSGPLVASALKAPVAPTRGAPVQPRATNIPREPSPEPLAAAPVAMAAAAATATAVASATTTGAAQLPPPPQEPSRARAVPSASHAATEDTLAVELRLLERLHAAERTAPASVLALCSEHEREFPRGAFVEEREAARAVARCSALPSAVEREAISQSFTARFPRSPQRARVDAACARTR